MKKRKIVFILSCITIITICALNVRNSLSITSELDYSNFEDLLTLNSASAEEAGSNCTGTPCTTGNGIKYTDFVLNGTRTCCALASEISGNKSN